MQKKFSQRKPRYFILFVTIIQCLLFYYNILYNKYNIIKQLAYQFKSKQSRISRILVMHENLSVKKGHISNQYNNPKIKQHSWKRNAVYITTKQKYTTCL